MKRIGMVALAVLALLLSSCSGGSSDPADPGPTVSDGSITGTVTVTGLPLADLTDLGEVGSQDADKWAAWLIDTTEDVDNIGISNGDQTLELTAVPEPGVYLLVIGLLPAADLSGGIEPVTEVAVSLPVTITENVTTVSNISVEFIADTLPSSLHGASQAGTGYRIRLDYSLSGPEQLQERVELNWVNRSLRSDSDGDGRFDNEPEYLDTDRDCLSDAQFERLQQGPTTPQIQTAQGSISHISMMMHNFRVGNQTFRTDEMTRVLRDGQRVHFQELAVGDEVLISYVEGMNRMRYARRIEVQD